MRRGEIRWVGFDPAQGAEATNRRPAVIISNDGVNTAVGRLGRGVVTVVALTANITRIHPFQVLLPAAETGLRNDSKAQAEQIRSVAVHRVGDIVGRVPATLMRKIDDAVRLHLGL
jgi:mRNA interferase MazF